MSDGPEKTTRAGFAAIIGAPNAGKSTLMNALVGSRSPSSRISTDHPLALRGILMEGETQIILIDTPGIFAPRRKLDQAMVEAAWQQRAGDADAVLCSSMRPVWPNAEPSAYGG